jgi:hypothetical protein
MVYPAAGVAVSTGSAWGGSYTVGTGANNLVQLNGSSQLPAVSAALLTNFPTLNQNTTGTAAGLSSTLAVASGGTGATTLTGPLKGNGTLAFSAAGYADIVGLWTACSSGYLKFDGSCATPGGTGTVTVVSSGSLTSTALVTGGGTTTLQTPAATATMDASGNISTPGSITTGAGGSTAGVIELGQGTAPTAGTTSVKLYAPASVTSYIMNLPGSASTGYLYGTNSAGVVTLSNRTIQAADVPTLNQNTTGTAAALAANGSNCSAGSFPLGVDAAGAVESCTAVTSIGVTAGQMPALTGDVTTSAGAVATALAAKYKTGIKSMTVFDPVTGDSGRVQFMFPNAVTITSISCSVKAATSATINLDERAFATPDTTGTSVLTSNLACDTDGATSTTFSNAGIAANVPVALLITAVSGTPDTLRVYVTYTID